MAEKLNEAGETWDDDYGLDPKIPTDQPVVAERFVVVDGKQRKVIPCPDGRDDCEVLHLAPEPVATLPACLCGLDTNPVTSPRMDIHCPKHDAHGGEPGLLACPFCGGRPRFERDARAAAEDIQGPIYQMIACSQCQSGPPWDEEEDVPNATEQCKARLIAVWNTRVSQPADWLKDKETERLKDERNQLAQQGAELWQRGRRERHGEVEPAHRCNVYDGIHAGGIGALSAPGDEVAQRARAAAEEITAHLFATVFHPSRKGGLSESQEAEIATIITTRFTATDVEQGTCTWTCEPNPDIEMWETDCGNTFQLEADGPTENKMKFCCYCGKQLAEKVAEGREEGKGDG